MLVMPATAGPVPPAFVTLRPFRDLDIAGLLTVTTSYRFFDHWFTRFNWNRVMSNDSRDSDVFLLGVGYRWAAR